MSVFVICHKSDSLSVELDHAYRKLYVGQISLSKPDDGCSDATGFSISNRNAEYCELTGAYWIWRNTQSSIKGLVHYRRYFVKRSFSLGSEKILDKDDIDRLLKTHDCIVPKKLKLACSVEDHYKKCHLIEDWELLSQLLHKRYPEYDSAFVRLSKQQWLYPYNMLIARKEIFDAYCKWLFPLLNDLYYSIDVSDRDNYQRRVIGFLAERLMTLWFSHNSMSLVEKKVVQIG